MLFSASSAISAFKKFYRRDLGDRRDILEREFYRNLNMPCRKRTAYVTECGKWDAEYAR